MAKFELSISEDYVSDWTIVEAMRELFQNALDQEIINEYNKMTTEIITNATEYKCGNGSSVSANTYTMRIGNKESVLDTKSLLLGESTKRGDSKTIGKFGEGYKLALLVLCRLGKRVTIYNYGSREIWRPRLSRSQKYGNTKILVVESERKYFWQEVPDNDLVFEVEGITIPEYQKIIESNLYLLDRETSKVYRKLGTYNGDILLDELFKGKVFVSGLYVNTDHNLHYGYNFKPEHIELDRDRRMVQSFNLYWATSKMWWMSKSELLVELAKKKTDDLRYLQHMYSYDGSLSVNEQAYLDFATEYGNKAVPVIDEGEVKAFHKMYPSTNVKTVIVTEATKSLITKSTGYNIGVLEKLEKLPPREDPYTVLTGLYDRVKVLFNEEEDTLFQSVIEESKSWKLSE